MNPLPTVEHLMSLGMADYLEHRQCDAQECMTYILNLFYPHINDKQIQDTTLYQITVNF